MATYTVLNYFNGQAQSQDDMLGTRQANYFDFPGINVTSQLTNFGSYQVVDTGQFNLIFAGFSTIAHIYEVDGRGTATAVVATMAGIATAQITNVSMSVRYYAWGPALAGGVTNWSRYAPSTEVVFSGADTLTGNIGDDLLRGYAGNDSMTGGHGNDILDGGAGADTMDGGAGNDRYGVDVAGDVVIEAAGGGTDTVFASIGYNLGANVERLVLGFSFVAINGSGNDGDNQIDGNDSANVLYGNGGNDSLLGWGGNDSLVGHDGNDTLIGGGGNDALIGGSGNDGATGDDGNDYIRLDDGNDAARGGAGHDQLYGNGGNDTLWGGVGNDYVAGGDGTDVIRGDGGYDYLDGQGGADYYQFEARGFQQDAIMSFVQGQDQIQISSGIFSSYAQVAAATSVHSGHTFINAGNGDIIVIANFTGTLNLGIDVYLF